VESRVSFKMPGSDQHIGPYVLSTTQRTLTIDDRAVHVGDRAFDILCVLAERPGEVIPKRQLLERIWPQTIVDEGSLRVQINLLRKALDPTTQVQILNVVGRGYVLSVVGRSVIPELNEAPRPHNLPARRTRLIGRDALVADLVSEARGSRLLTLVGPGGVGKTSVALAVADDIAGQFDQIIFVDFSSVDEPIKALLSVTMALNLPADAGDAPAAILAQLSRGSSLLLLDNCEHVVEEVARLADVLLSSGARVRILATSREPLNIASERIRRVEPLETPPVGALATISDALLFPAVQLFVERAADTSDFVFVDDDTSAVAEICRSLDGLPLAIELAAGWVRALPPRTLARQLAQQPLLALQGRRTAQARHRTIEAMLDWSYDSLSPRQQLLFASLSAFRGGFSIEQALALASSPLREATLDLADLVSKSLVDVSREGGEARYRLLLLPRAYAEARLRESERQGDIRWRHAQIVLEASRTIGSQWWDEPRQEWLPRAARLVDDLRAAVDWALDEPRVATLAGELAHEAAAIWFRLSPQLEGPSYIEAALEKLSRTPEPPLGLVVKLKIEHAVLQAYTRALSEKTLAALAELDHDVRATNDSVILRLHAWASWFACISFGDYTAALRFTHTFERLGTADEGDAITALHMVSSCCFFLGDLAHAQEGFERLVRRLEGGARRFRGTPFQFDPLASVYRHLGLLRWLRGDPQGALDAADQAVTIAENALHSMTAGPCLMVLAAVGLLCGDYDRAEAALDRHQALPVVGGLHRDIVDGLWGALIGPVDPQAAVPYLGRCLEGEGLIYFCFGSFSPLLGRMCEYFGDAGDPERGLRYLEKVLEQQLGSQPSEFTLPELRRAKAALLQMQALPGWREQTDTLLAEGLEQAHAQGSVAWELRIRTDQARLWASDGLRDKATEALQEVISRHPAAPITADRGAAEHLFSEIRSNGP
jgi:predicted ATPase/DNA-binding winged helix-turn-helix (wHTH) protein